MERGGAIEVVREDPSRMKGRLITASGRDIAPEAGYADIDGGADRQKDTERQLFTIVVFEQR